jgi:hypothetical protein
VFAGVFFIFFGLVVLLIAPRKAELVAEKFRQFNSEIDPNIFKFAFGVLGVFAIILGALALARDLR